MRIKMNYAGFRELRTSPGTKALVDEHADSMAARANSVPSTTDPEATEDYYKVWDASDNKRARARIATTSERAAKHEAKTQALQKSL